MEDMLPVSLKNILSNILKDNILINWRIFGGEHTIISLKFESPHADQPIATEESANHSRPLIQQYRRKSPSSIERDIHRHAEWQSRCGVVSYSDQNKQHVIELNRSGVVANKPCEEGGLLFMDTNTHLEHDSGFANSTVICDEDNRPVSSQHDSTAQTDSILVSESSQTEHSCGQSITIQTDDISSRDVQGCHYSNNKPGKQIHPNKKAQGS